MGFRVLEFRAEDCFFFQVLGLSGFRISYRMYIFVTVKLEDTEFRVFCCPHLLQRVLPN